MRFRDEILRRLDNWGQGIPAPPLRLVLYLTARCNLDCPFCEVPQEWRRGRSEPELSLRQWTAIVQEAIALGVLEWWFPGQGEPFHPPGRALSIIREIKGRSPVAFCHFTTNGTLLSPRVCEQLVDLGVDDINFSIDGPDAETHDSMRGQRGTFQRAMGAMRSLRELKKEHGSGKPNLTLTTVLSAKNYLRIPEMVDLAAEVGATEISINPLRVSRGNRAGLDEHGLQIPASLEGSVRRILRDAQRDGESRGVRVKLNGWGDIEMGIGSGRPAEGFERTHHGRFDEAACFEPFYSMGIGASGKATFCASASDIGTSEGDVSRFGLRDVWYGGFMMEARARLLEHRPAINCFGCGIKSVRMGLKEEMRRRNIN